MTGEHVLLQLAERLRACTAAEDWSALANADREVAAALRRLAARDALSPTERSVLAQLRSAHRDAHRRCALEAERARVRLEELGERRDAWMAYAVGEWEGAQA